MLFSTGLHCVFPASRSLPARKVLQIRFTERSKYVYFFKGKAHSPLAKYMLVRDVQHESGADSENLVLMECMLGKDEELSVQFYWKDNRERVYMIDFGINKGLAQNLEPDEAETYTLYSCVCCNKESTQTDVTARANGGPARSVRSKSKPTL